MLKRPTGVLVPFLFLFTSVAAAAAPQKELTITITLDNTGVADPRYLNRANPPHIDEQGVVQFSNRTVDQTMEVRFAVVFRSGAGDDVTSLQTQIAELAKRVDDLAGQGKPSSEVDELRKELTKIHARLDVLETAATPEEPDVRRQYENQLTNCHLKSEGMECTATFRVDRNARVVIPNALLRLTPKDEIELTVRFFSSTDVPANPTAYVRKSHKHTLTIQPGPRFGDSEAIRASGRTFPRHDVLQFENISKGDVMLAIPIHFKPAIRSQVRAVRTLTGASRRTSIKDLQSRLAKMLGCSAVEGCPFYYHLLVPSGTTTELVDEVIELAYPPGKTSSAGMREIVATIVDGKTSVPAQDVKKGRRVTLIATGEEAEDKKEIKVLASLGGSVAPALDRVDASKADSDPIISIDPDHRLKGDTRATAIGSGTLQIAWGVGNVADGSVSLGYKKGEFGANSTSNVSAAQYQVNYHTFGGTRLQFGKFSFAEPSSKIAVSEEGEGIRISSPLIVFDSEKEPRALGLNVSHIFKRQSLLPLRSQNDDHDSYVTIAELTNVPIDPLLDWLEAENGIRVRGLNLIGLVGRDEKKQHPHRYTTVGGEITAGRENIWQRGLTKQVSLTGTLSYYASRNGTIAHFPPADAGPSRGRGSVGMTTWTLSQTTRENADPDPNGDWLATVLYGQGSADDPKTTPIDEGYIGETAAFAPDLIFLNSLQPAMTVGKVAGIAPSLSNKQYLGLRYTTSNPSASLLRAALVHLFRMDPENDIASTSTSLSIHSYRFRRKVFDSKDGGKELDVEFLVKAPRGVTAAVSLGYFNRGAALRSLITRRPWTAGFVISFEP
jgi:hypothetical protein